MMQRGALGSIPLLVLASLLGSQVVLAGSDGRIGVLFVGEPFAPPFYMMLPDPLFDISFVDAHWHASGTLSPEQVHRMIRLYMPRTVGSLINKFDVVVMFCATQDAVGIKYTEMISRSVEEGGVGLFMSGSQEGFGGFQDKPSWGGTSIARLLPVGVIDGGRTLFGTLVIDRPEHELISSIPWNMKHPVLASTITWRHNTVTLKPGADQLAHTVYQGVREPLMVTWEVAEQARVFALSSEIHILSTGLTPWKYHYDFASNLVIYLADRPVPQDTEIVSRARTEILRISLRRSILVDLLEFGELFGADTGKILSRIEEVDAVISQANQQFVQLRFEEMLETSKPIESMLEELEQEAMEIKDQALLWVYAIEWLAVTGTALTCAFILWTVMIQRKLYKEVQVTRAR
jgi:uncharacterized membrane protein